MKISVQKLRGFDQTPFFIPVVWMSSLIATVSGLYIASLWQNRVFTNMFSRYDTSYYRAVSELGYLRELPMADGKILANRNAFFPTFPMAMRFFDRIFPGNSLAAGLVLNALITLATLFIFYKFCLLIFDRQQAALTLLAFAFFPGAYIFFWLYAEAFLVFFIVCAMYFLAKKHIWISAIFIAIATLTRPNAVAFAVMVPLFIICEVFDRDFYKLTNERLQHYGIALAKALAAFAISISGFVAFLCYLSRLTGIDRVWFRIQKEGWGEGTKPFRQIGQYVKEIPNAAHPFNNWVVILFIVLGFAFLGALGLYMHKMKYEPFIVALSIPSMIVVLLALSNNVACGSPRFYAVAPPIFMALTTLFPPRAMKYIIGIFIVLQIFTSAFYTWPYNTA